jgi:hypothetical protein
MLDYPVKIKNLTVFLSPKIMVGIQPKEQNFFTSEMEFFGLMGSRIDFQIHKNLLPYLEVTAKTNGWVAGNEFLKKDIGLKIGDVI